MSGSHWLSSTFLVLVQHVFAALLVNLKGDFWIKSRLTQTALFCFILHIQNVNLNNLTGGKKGF